jgi:S1-C subfamily serine protease
VSNVESGSVADYAGLRAGDVILSINDVNVMAMDHNRAKMEFLRCGNDFKLTIKRLVTTF